MYKLCAYLVAVTVWRPNRIFSKPFLTGMQSLFFFVWVVGFKTSQIGFSVTRRLLGNLKSTRQKSYYFLLYSNFSNRWEMIWPNLFLYNQFYIRGRRNLLSKLETLQTTNLNANLRVLWIAVDWENKICCKAYQLNFTIFKHNLVLHGLKLNTIGAPFDKEKYIKMVGFKNRMNKHSFHKFKLFKNIYGGQ